MVTGEPALLATNRVASADPQSSANLTPSFHRMKLLHYQLGSHGGAEYFFLQLVNALHQRGVEQKVVIGPQRSWRSQLPAEVEVVSQTKYRSLSVDRITQPLRINRLIKRWRPNALLSWMMRGARMLPANGETRKFARIGDMEPHLGDYAHADTLVCVTPIVEEHVRQLGWKGSTEVISNFTRDELVSPIDRRLVSTPVDAPVLCTLARLVPGKGVDLMIRSLCNLPNVHLWIVGEGKEESALRRLAQDLFVSDRTHFLGWKNDPRPYLASADAFGLASRKEALGNVVLEAWAQGTPVISTRTDGPNWLITDGLNGRLVDIDDEIQFANAVAETLRDQQARKRMTHHGFLKLRQEFGKQQVVDRYLEVLFP